MRCGSRQRIHAASQIDAMVALHHVGIVFQARIDLAAVASRCTPSRLMGLEHHDVGALLRQVQSGRQAGDSRAHDDDIRAPRALEHWQRDAGSAVSW
jgi:hypothetical protein